MIIRGLLVSTVKIYVIVLVRLSVTRAGYILIVLMLSHVFVNAVGTITLQFALYTLRYLDMDTVDCCQSAHLR